MNDLKRKTWFQRIKGTRGYVLLNTFVKSASVGLLFATLCFVYDVYHDSKQDKQLEESVNKLKDIEQGLSTRYLGLFPTYIEDICSIFENLNPSDTIVIFEDVLYYGIKSRPSEFYKLYVKLFEHAINGGSVTIAYYDFKTPERGPYWATIFHKIIIDSRIDTKFHPMMLKSRHDEFQRIRKEEYEDSVVRTIHHRIDSSLCEEYFSKTRDNDLEKFRADVDAYLSKDLISEKLPTPTPRPEQQAFEMCVRIDSVKQYYLGNKPVEGILFCDFEQMYREMSRIITEYDSINGVKLIPLNEYLTMSCWMVKKGNRKDVKTVLAFPSKYSTDEIGFYSQDEAFSRYIGTMLDGVMRNRRWGQDN